MFGVTLEYGMNAVVRSLVVGSILEVVTVFRLVPKDSTQPPTAIQSMLGYTQLPGAGAFRFLFGTVGGFLDSLPPALGFGLGIAGFGVVFLIQVAVLALPLWLVFRWWRLRPNGA
jgi:hypothetical protein